MVQVTIDTERIRFIYRIAKKENMGFTHTDAYYDMLELCSLVEKLFPLEILVTQAKSDEEKAQRELIERGAVSMIKDNHRDYWLPYAQGFIQQMGPALDGGPMEKFIREECV